MARQSPHERLAETLNERRVTIALRVADKHLAANPMFLRRFGATGRSRCIEDAEFHVRYLAHALDLAAPALFVAYAQWARLLLEKRRIPWSDLQKNLELLRDELGQELEGRDARVVRDYIDAALRSEPAEAPSFLAATPREPLARAYLTALLHADRRKADEFIDDAVRSAGLTVRELYLEVFQPVQREIGRLWQNNELSVAEEHYCTASTQAIMARFYPQILATARVGRKAVIACVGNELHEIGARMVADFFEMDGWDAIYVGANTPSGSLVDLVARERPNIIALSVTMTYHLATAAEIVDRIHENERCRDLKIIAGGYVLLQHADLWRSLGVDGYADDAAAAVGMANNLLHGSRT